MTAERDATGHRPAAGFGWPRPVDVVSGGVIGFVMAVAFLSSTVLELFAAIGVAMVAVFVGFSLLGALVIVVFWRGARQAGDRAFRRMWLAIVLSFAFYIPVVLFAEMIPMIGMLMIPKTLAYVWIVVMGLNLYRQTKREQVSIN